MSSENAHTWTIPLNISVSLGAPNIEAERAEPVPRKERDFAEWWIFGGSDEPRDVFSDAAGRFSLNALSQDVFSWQGAMNAALCSWLAYEAEAKVQSTTKNTWGFETCEFVSKDDTECFVASTPKAVVVSFRGTQEAGDWLINLNLSTTRASYGYVHRGFHSAFASVRGRLEQILADTDAQNKKVIITGHSLGGATGTIAAAEWRGKYPISGVFTFGQPAVGFSAFRSFISMRYGNSFRRFVNDDDIVPQVPPRYRHCGKLYHFDSSSGFSHERFAEATTAAEDTPMMTIEQFESFRSQLKSASSGDPTARESFDTQTFQEGFFPSFADHSIDRYIEKVMAQLG